MSIIRIHHVQITIPHGAEEQARQFYCRFLKLPEIEKPVSLERRGGFWLEVGHQQIHVGTEPGVERTATKAHIAYQVDDLGAWREGLAEQGITVVEGIAIPGYERFEFRDPCGNRVEFLQPVE
jgi:catechol 2,3-dioxygenase-like lactoylglutathione lyase family enzyme